MNHKFSFAYRVFNKRDFVPFDDKSYLDVQIAQRMQTWEDLSKELKDNML